MLWTNELIELLQKRVAEGCSASQIGNEFGVSRNAIIGKANRLKLQLAGRPNPGGKLTRAAGVAPAWMLQTEAVELPIESKSKNQVTLVHLKTRSCRWPTGPLLYCGETNVEGYPYCAWHCHISYRRPE